MSPRQSSDQLFWHWEDLQIVGPKILLANPPPWCQGLRERLWCLFSLQSSPPQALRWSSIFGCTNAPIENLLIDFVTGLSVSIDWKGDSYNSILIIIDWLTNMVHYKPVKITLDAPGLAEVIIDVVVRHHGLLDSIVTNRGSFSPRNSGYCSVTSLALNRNFLLHSTLKLIIRLSDKTAPWERTSKPLWTSSKMTRPGFYRWPSLLTITQRTWAPVIRLLS